MLELVAARPCWPVAASFGDGARQGVARMSSRSARWWLVWALAGLSVAMFVASLPLYLLARSAPCPRRGFFMRRTVGEPRRPPS